RGEFDNLAGQGKPQDLTTDHHAGDRESGFRVLKNNGPAPAWIEADKAIRAEQAALAELAARTASFITEHLDDETTNAPAPAAPTFSARLRRLWSGSRRPAQPVNHFTRADLRNERDRVRREYLRRSDELNQTINEYNSALPFDLLWRERQKITPEQAAATFNSACPPVG
ncbi:MAG TPA: DnaJ family domain-containing protein, partial [Thermomicrobiales bacterium]|nr:DnaJ family domain-containing protein [Thermomicrobiales bacterium]